MSDHIVVERCGAVSPGGWGVAALLEITDANRALPSSPLLRPGWEMPMQAHPVPAPAARLPIFAHARLRRTSPVSQYAVAAALEALGTDQAAVTAGQIRLGVICCVMSGCVNYSRRFYDEALKDPSTASPLVFPETVFNAPSSHLASVLGATGLNYTVVGDPGTFVQALAMAANWLD
ncbi:MAG TPA: hypothetical protein VK968_03135, partial [Roseimicrobium sp.]|nr:hypothetical protein [Roseimicrobium sp.]